MTALLFFFESSNVRIAMDSLALHAETKRPFKYATKFFPLPHLRSVVCGTGMMNVLADWITCLQTQVIAKDIMYLDEIAPEQLQNIAANYGLGDESSSTIYHFGFNEQENRFVGFAYRATNKFQSESIEYGMGIKPADHQLLEANMHTISEQGWVAGFIEVMKQQKTLDDQRHLEERVGIGGEIHFLDLDSSGYTSFIGYRFEGYSEVFDEMLLDLEELNRQA